jgi:hypothetical protein
LYKTIKKITDVSKQNNPRRKYQVELMLSASLTTSRGIKMSSEILSISVMEKIMTLNPSIHIPSLQKCFILRLNEDHHSTIMDFA